MDSLTISNAVAESYDAVFKAGSVAHLVINQKGLIVWFSSECFEIFGVPYGFDIKGNSLDRFLPPERRGAWHLRMIAGVFTLFKAAIEKGETLDPQSMGKMPDGKPKEIDALQLDGTPTRIAITFAPLIVEGIVYAVAFIVSNFEAERGNIAELVQDEARIVIQTKQLKVVQEITAVAKDHYTGVRGWLANNVFDHTEQGRRKSAVTAVVVQYFGYGFIVFTALVAYGIFRAQPQFNHWNLYDPGVPSSPDSSPQRSGNPPGWVPPDSGGQSNR